MRGSAYTRCTAIQLLLASADLDFVCNALLVTNRAPRKWINRFNHCGVDGLIVDNATWQRRKDTNRHRRQPKYSPPYWPDLDPIVRICLTLEARWFNNHVCKNEQQLLERLDQAILDLTLQLPIKKAEPAEQALP